MSLLLILDAGYWMCGIRVRCKEWVALCRSVMDCKTGMTSIIQASKTLLIMNCYAKTIFTNKYSATRVCTIISETE